MPVDFEWDSPERRIMRYRIHGHWDWNQFHKTLRRSTLRFDDTTHHVSVIIDLREGGQPMPAGAVGHLRSLLNSLAHMRFGGQAVLIGVDASLQRALGVQDSALRTSRGMIHFADDEDSARRILSA